MKLKLIIFLILNLLFVSLLNAQDVKCSKINQELRTGSTHSEVVVLQEFLYKNKFLKSKIYGYFGSATKQALISFQRANKLKTSGYVDLQTKNFINKSICGTSANIIQNISTSTVPNELNIIKLNSKIFHIKDKRLCDLKEGSLEWGDGTFEIFGKYAKFNCDEGIYFGYAKNGTYELKVKDKNNLRFINKIIVDESAIDSPYIKHFTSTNLGGGKYSLSWSAINVNQCKILGLEKGYSDLKNNDEIIIETNSKNDINLVCSNEAGHQANAWLNLLEPTKSLIYKMHTYGFGSQYFIEWETKNGAKRCYTEGIEYKPNFVGRVIMNGNGVGFQVECYKESLSDTKSTYVSPQIVYKKPVIEIFESRVIGTEAVLTWNVKYAELCYILGGPFTGSFGVYKYVQVPSGSLSASIYSDNKFKLVCSNGNTQTETSLVAK